MDARRRTGFETLETQTKRAQRIGQRLRRRHTVRTAFARILPYDDAPTKEGTGCDNHRFCRMARANRSHNRGYRAVLRLNRHDFILHELQAYLPLEGMLHIRAVFDAVGLRAQRMDRRAFAAVEHAILNTSRIGSPRHFTAQRINLAHQMAFCRAADSRIARHVADRVQIDGKTSGFHSKARGGKRRLNARVSRADHDNIKCFGRKNRHESSSFYIASQDLAGCALDKPTFVHTC